MRTDRARLPSLGALWSEASIVVKFSLLFGALIALFVGVLGIASYGGAVRVMQEEAESNARLAIEQVRNSVDATLDGVDKASYILFSNPEVLRALKLPGGLAEMDGRLRYTVSALVTDVAFANQVIDSLALYDFLGGKILSNGLVKDLSPTAFSPAAMEADGRFALAGYDLARESLHLVRLLRDMDMKPVGYLRADVRGNAFRGAFPTELLASKSSLLLADGQQVVVAEGVEISAKAMALALSAAGKSGSFSIRSNDVDYAVSFYNSQNYSFRIVGFVPTGRIGAASGRLGYLTLAASVVTILVFLVVSWFLVRRLLKPILRIADDMRHWDLSTRITADHYGGTDEIAYLALQSSSMMERIRTLVDQLVEERSHVHKQELAALQAQINPHFLYNTLEIVNWMAIERGASDIASIVRSLSDMMRYAIGNGEETARVSEELAYVESYLALQGYRFPDKFDSHIVAPKEVLTCEMPKLCLQPLVENSIQHGFKGLRRKGTLNVVLAIEGDDLVAIVEDDGNGMDENKVILQEHSGIGVYNVDQRLKLRYGASYGLTYASVSGQGTTCTLRIPARRSACTV